MKTSFFYIIIFLVLFSGFYPLNGYSQKGAETGTQYGKGEDSIRCIMNLSLYIEYYRHKNYQDAIGPWRIVFNECPASRESLYAYGIEMYRAFIGKEKDPAMISAYCDTILMIHDQRIKYFGDEGNVLGRKGVDLLRYKRMDGVEFVMDGYNCLKKSIEIEKEKSSPVVLTTFISASISLFMNNALSNEQVINDYVEASDIVDHQLSRRADSRTKMAREAIDTNIKESGALTCEAVVSIFGPKFKNSNPDKGLLLKITEFLTIAQCENEKLFADASVKLYEIEPSAEAAYNLARLFLRKDEFQTSAKYYTEAIERTTNTENKANYYYELGLLNFQHLKNNKEAISYALEASSLKPNWGDPYLLMGTAYLAGRNEFSDNFEQQTVFWIAVDMFNKASSVDTSVSDRASSLVRDYSNYFPTLEDLFFRSIKEGEPYTIRGWINRSTIARARK